MPRATGKLVSILHKHPAEHMVWRLQLLHEAGLMHLIPVPHRVLPPGFSATLITDKGPKSRIVKVYSGLVRLLGLKWNIDAWKGHGTTFAWDFAAAWCQVTKDVVRGAMKWLLANQYLHVTGQVNSGRFGSQMNVFLPTLPPWPREQHVQTPEATSNGTTRKHPTHLRQPPPTRPGHRTPGP
jgi:hypothetical protein